MWSWGWANQAWNGIANSFHSFQVGFTYGGSGGAVDFGTGQTSGFNYVYYYGGMAAGAALGTLDGTTEAGAALRIGEGAATGGEELASSSIAKWNDGWPANGGSLGKTYLEYPKVGYKFDRYGSEVGKHVSPLGTSFEARSLRSASENSAGAYRQYEVIKDFDQPMVSSLVSPAFGYRGMGIQHLLPETIEKLKSTQFIDEI